MVICGAQAKRGTCLTSLILPQFLGFYLQPYPSSTRVERGGSVYLISTSLLFTQIYRHCLVTQVLCFHGTRLQGCVRLPFTLLIR